MKSYYRMLVVASFLLNSLVTLRAEMPVYEGFDFTGEIKDNGSGRHFIGNWVLASGDFSLQNGSF